MNRLSQEKSPYLLQHAENPVHWYPWGEEAFAAARRDNKPIFLSIGYSTCHWCHVMAHESFENSDVAAVMNEHFINIKVDREERPDVDHLYMATVQMLSGSGGWPMSVWLTPDLKPFYGGTYFPPEDRYGRTGFKTVLLEIGGIWKNEKTRVLTSADQITNAVREAVDAGPEGPAMELDPTDLFRRAFETLEQSFDRQEGGFGRAPKFPMPGYLNFLLRYFSRTKNSSALSMVDFTMKKMARGGIYDQLGGGFSRYSTDQHWIVPHFEKMLYDNAQLIAVAVSLFQATQDDFFKKLAEESIAYIRRDMTHPDGGFYSAEDADSEGKEGTFYLWTLAEIKENLDPESAEKFISHFGVTVNGNFKDPHSDDMGKNILVQARELKEIPPFLGPAKKKLFEVRSRRPRPHLDDKILTDWNGLMISALAKAGAVGADKPYVESAEKAARFLQANLYDKNTGELFRRWRKGEKKIPAFQTDYAFLVRGLLDLFEATGQPDWLEWAVPLHDDMNKKFFDQQKGGYFMSAAKDLFINVKEEADGVLPSGNSVAVLNGVRLAKLLGRSDLNEWAQRTISAFSKTLKIHPPALLEMLTALDERDRDSPQIIVVGPMSDPSTSHLLALAHKIFRPGKMVIPVQPGVFQERLAKISPSLGSMVMLHGKPTAYVCVNFSCQNPTTEASELEQQLSNL